MREFLFGGGGNSLTTATATALTYGVGVSGTRNQMRLIPTSHMNLLFEKCKNHIQVSGRR